MDENNVFDLRAALADQVPLFKINQFLSEGKDFDYQSAKADLIADYRRQLLDQGMSDPGISDEKLANDADEEILVFLSDGQIVKEEFPKLRGMSKGVLVDVPTGAAMFKGAQAGFKFGQALPIPNPAKAVATAATTAAGAAGLAIPTYGLGEFLTGQIFEGEDVVPSQRPIVEAARTYSGTLASLYAIPSLFKAGAETTIDLGANWLKKNIDGISNKWLRRAARPAQYATRGAEMFTKGAITSPPTSGGQLRKAATLGTFSAAPAAGAYFAETVDPYDPLTRIGSEVTAPFLVPGRLLGSLSVGALKAVGQGIRNLSKEGRLDAASQQLNDALEQVHKQYLNTPNFDPEAYQQDLLGALQNPALYRVIDEVNRANPTEQIPYPELSVAMLTGDKAFEALERGARRATAQAEGQVTFGDESKRMFNDFNVFARRIIQSLIQETAVDPSALRNAAEIQEALFSEMLTQRLQLADDAARVSSDKVQTPLKRKALSQTMVTEVMRAYDEATKVGSALYDRASENLNGVTLTPSRTLQAIQELQEITGGPLPKPVKTLLDDLLPDTAELERSVTNAERIAASEADNLQTNLMEARNYLAENPSINQSFYTNFPMRPPESIPTDKDPLAYLFDSSVPANDQLALIDNYLAGLSRKTDRDGGSKSLIGLTAFLKKMRRFVSSRNDSELANGVLEQARRNLDETEASAVDVNRLLRSKQEMGALQRGLSPNVNQRQTIFDVSEIEDALMRDIDDFIADQMPNRINQETGQMEFPIEGGEVPLSVQGFEDLFRANAWHRARHDIFTRTFANEIFRKTSQGNKALDPKLFAQKLFQGSSDVVSQKLLQVQDAVNYLNAAPFARASGELPEDVLQELQNTAINRIGTYKAAELDFFKTTLRNIMDQDPTSPTFNRIDPRRAQKFLNDNQESIEPFFPDAFADLRDAIAGRRQVDDLLAEIADTEKSLNETTQLFRRFSRMEDSPGRIVGDYIGTPQSRPVNVIKNLNQMFKEIDDIAQKDSTFDPMAAKRAFAGVVLDRASIYASGGDVTQPLNFERFRAFLFDPLDNRDGPSISALLKREGVISEEQFNKYKVVLDQAKTISRVMSETGPRSSQELIDKGFILQNIITRAAGAASGGLFFRNLENVVGNIPGASMSIAQNFSNATAKLGLGAPRAKIRDLFAKAFTDKDTLEMLLARRPKTREQLIKYASEWPQIFLAAGIRQGIDLGEQAASPDLMIPMRGAMPQAPQEEESLEQRLNRMQDESMGRVQAPLSIRNNNPGNLRLAGQPGAVEGEGGFAAFPTPQAGLMALRRQVALDTQERGLTLQDFIAKYAPESENDMSSYLSFLQQQTGLAPTQRVPSSKIDSLVKAIVQMEGGQEAMGYFFQPRRMERPTAQVSRPTAQPMSMPMPAPMPQAAPPAPAPAAPNPQQRQQYAALFPNDPISGMITGRSGIASLAS